MCAIFARYLATCLSQPCHLLRVGIMGPLTYPATRDAETEVVVTVQR